MLELVHLHTQREETLLNDGQTLVLPPIILPPIPTPPPNLSEVRAIIIFCPLHSMK